MGRSHKYLEPDARGRFALGSMARHDLYLVTVAADGIITMTPAEVTPLITPPPVRKRPARKKAAAATGEKLQEGQGHA